MFIREIISNGFLSIFGDNCKKHATGRMGIKNIPIKSWETTIKKACTKELFKDLNYNWVFKAVKELPDSEKHFASIIVNALYPGSGIDKFVNILNINKDPLKDDEIWGNALYKRLLDHWILNKIDIPFFDESKEELLKSNVGSLLKLNEKQIHYLIYALGLIDITNALAVIVDSKKIKIVAKTIDRRFRSIFNYHMRVRDMVSITSLTVHQMFFYIDRGQGLDFLINSYGIWRISAALTQASEAVRQYFYCIAGINISESIKNTILSIKESEKNKYFIKSMLSSMFFITGEDFGE
ncbi:MAG: hypothetical protein KAH32_02560 [Chlamydiia bacterium]|nr:hypothetical protein [Chlamydiia bacterium]